MSGYLSKEQVDKILAGINPGRVSERDGQSYLQAYEVRAQMARVYGIARWSSEVVEQHMLFEREVKTKAGKDAWYVGYRSIVKITVYAPDGTYLATYTEGHAGSSTHPELGEAHGNAITNSESYAFKRAAVMALLDDGGLSLYGRGSKRPLVNRTLFYPFEGSKQAAAQVEPTGQVEEERDVDVRHAEPPEPAPDPRENNAAPTVEDKTNKVAAFLTLVDEGPAEGTALPRWHAKLLARATAERLLGESAPGGVTVKTYIDLARDERKQS
jgi:hypothetical protein